MKGVILPAARRDILAQFIYLVEQGAPRAAERFIDAVDEVVLRLLKNPSIGSPKKLQNPRLKGLRKWPVEGFEAVQIYYLAANEALRVVRVLHGRRDVERILDQ